MNLREEVVKFHNEKIQQRNSTLERWQMDFVKENVPKEEWERIYNGLIAERTAIIEYTNNFLIEQGLEPLNY